MNDNDPKKPSTFMTYLTYLLKKDWAMSEYLPHEEFKQLKNVNEFNVMSINGKGLIEYLLEIDLERSGKLH